MHLLSVSTRRRVGTLQKIPDARPSMARSADLTYGINNK